jgi:hypothetical protein
MSLVDSDALTSNVKVTLPENSGGRLVWRACDLSCAADDAGIATGSVATHRSSTPSVPREAVRRRIAVPSPERL